MKQVRAFKVWVRAASHPLFFCEDVKQLKFYTVDNTYVKQLYQIDTEEFYLNFARIPPPLSECNERRWGDFTKECKDYFSNIMRARIVSHSFICKFPV